MNNNETEQLPECDDTCEDFCDKCCREKDYEC